MNGCTRSATKLVLGSICRGIEAGFEADRRTSDVGWHWSTAVGVFGICLTLDSDCNRSSVAVVH